MCIQYLSQCRHCNANVENALIKCPWTDLPRNCALRSFRRLDGIYTTCIDCWLDININQQLRFEELEEQIKLDGELYKTGAEEGEIEKEMKQDTKEEIEDEQGEKPKRLRLSLRFKGKK